MTSEQKCALTVAVDTFATLPAKVPYLRIAVVHCVALALAKSRTGIPVGSGNSTRFSLSPSIMFL